MQGKLELMMGPMRSNKTAELLRRADMRRQYAKQYVMVLKPSDDTKGGPGVVESRNPNGGGKMSAVEFNPRTPGRCCARSATRSRRLASAWSASPSTKASLSISSSSLPSICSTRATMFWWPGSTSTSAPALRRDAEPDLAGERLRRQHHRVHGLLRLRSARPLLAAPHRRQARGHRQPRQSARRLLRAALRGAFVLPGRPH